MSSDEQFDPSELGTKEYWDALYEHELQNHTEDASNEGTIWFTESNAEAIVRKQLDKLASRGLLRRRPGDQPTSKNEAKPSRFLDLGTGNGHMLFSLRSPTSSDSNDAESEPWEGEMVGIDYSPSSIALANQILTQQTSSPKAFETHFAHWDLLNDPLDGSHTPWLGHGFDVVLDKGTFDAISLMQQQEGFEHTCEMYRSTVAQLVKRDGFLIVTSCNWTRDELVEWLAPDVEIEDESERELEFFEEAVYPTFTFGGKQGQSVVTVVFQQKGEGPHSG